MKGICPDTIEKKNIHDMMFYEKEDNLVVGKNTTDLKRKETLKAIETLSLLDDNLMTLVFEC